MLVNTISYWTIQGQTQTHSAMSLFTMITLWSGGIPGIWSYLISQVMYLYLLNDTTAELR